MVTWWYPQSIWWWNLKSTVSKMMTQCYNTMLSTVSLMMTCLSQLDDDTMISLVSVRGSHWLITFLYRTRCLEWSNLFLLHRCRICWKVFSCSSSWSLVSPLLCFSRVFFESSCWLSVVLGFLKIPFHLHLSLLFKKKITGSLFLNPNVCYAEPNAAQIPSHFQLCQHRLEICHFPCEWAP